jgi:hypothetical protein
MVIMAKCETCDRIVDVGADYCPGCGKKNPGQFANEGLVIGIIIIIGVCLCMFLLPAIIVIWPFSKSFHDAFETSLHSVWAWIGSAVFWGFLVYAGYTGNKENKS